MTQHDDFADLSVEVSDFVATVEMQRPPHNFFDADLIRQIAEAFERLDEDPACRAVVLAADGKSFCAGADFGDGAGGPDPGEVYRQALRLFRTKKPVVASVQGAAVGGGLGLALATDFRVTCPDARFSANFTRLGFHPGFGLSITMPELLGPRVAALLLYTGRRIGGEEALALGMADVLVPRDGVRSAAQELAGEIATSSPLGVVATRATLRAGLAERVEAALDRELAEQDWLAQTEDFKIGVDAMAAREVPVFTGR